MIGCARDGGLWTIVIDRPEKANSLTHEMLEALIAEAGRAHGVARAVILTGSGEVFSAGADLHAAREGLAVSPLWEELSAAIAALPCLTIAAINGTVAGGATGMALACDLRIAVPEARFFYPVLELGYLPQPSDVIRLAALVGPARARLLLAAGARLDAEEALRFGLVDRVVPAPDLAEAARTLAGGALAADPAHLAAIKAMIPASA